MATFKAVGARALWAIAAGRGRHEQTPGALKGNLAFNAVPAHDWVAIGVRQPIRVLAHNLVRALQLWAEAPARRQIGKRARQWLLESLQIVRFELFDLPARFVRPGGRPRLRFPVAPATRRRIQRTLFQLGCLAAGPDHFMRTIPLGKAGLLSDWG